jgi:hypothetical protein
VTSVINLIEVREIGACPDKTVRFGGEAAARMQQSPTECV